MITDTQFTFLIPGYLSPLRLNGLPEEAAADSTSPKLIQWRVSEEQLPWQAMLARALGDSKCNGLHLPAAELLSINTFNEESALRADPVHLRADRDTAKLYPRQMLGLTQDEEVELLASLNEFLSADGMQILPGADQGWYLYGEEASELASLPPSFLANRNASVYLPSGDGTEHWQRLMAELQMLIHHHPVNQQRAADGKLLINSLWLWGGGNLQQCVNQIGEDEKHHLVVYGNDDYTQALCQRLNISCETLDSFTPTAEGHSIVVDTRVAQAVFSSDELLAQRLVREIDRNWLTPICVGHRNGQQPHLVLMNEDGDIGEFDHDVLASVENPWVKFKRWLPRLGTGFGLGKD